MLQLASSSIVKVLSAALAVIRVHVHVLPLVPVTRPQANVCRTTNIQTAVDIIKCGARSGSPQLTVTAKTMQMSEFMNKPKVSHGQQCTHWRIQNLGPQHCIPHEFHFLYETRLVRFRHVERTRANSRIV